MPRAPIAPISRVPGVIAPSNTPREAFRVGQEGLAPLGILVGQQEQLLAAKNFAEARTILRRGLNEAQAAAKTQNNIGSITSDFDQASESILELARQSVQHDPVNLGRFEAEAALQVEARRSSVATIQTSRLFDAAQAAAIQYEDDVIREIDMADTPEDAERAIEMFEHQLRDIPGMTDTARAKRVGALRERADLFRMDKLVAANPSEALRIASDPETFADEFPGADPEKRLALLSVASTALGKQGAAIRERVASDLRIQVGRAQTPEEIADARAAIEDSFPEIISGTTRAQLQLSLDKQGENVLEVTAAFADVNESLATGRAAQQGSVDLFYEKMSQGEDFSQLDTATRRAVEVGLVQGTGRVPKGMEKKITGKLRSPDPRLAADGVEDFMTLVESFPQAQSDFSSQDVAMATGSAPQIRLGANPSEVIIEQRRLMKLPDEERKLRVELLREERSDTTDAEWLAEQPGLGTIQRFFFDADVEMNDRFIGAFSERVNTFVMLGNDVEQARQNAARDATARWSVTRADGVPRLMEFAPEVSYPEFGGDSAAIREQLVEDTLKLVSDQTGIFSAEEVRKQSENLRIGADFQTAREVDPSTGQPRPGYSVMLQTEEGPEVLLNQEGIPVRFYPDFPSSEAGKALAEERQRKLESAQAEEALLRKQQRNNLLKGKSIGDLFGMFLDVWTSEHPGKVLTGRSGEGE